MPATKSRTKALRKGRRKKVFSGVRRQDIAASNDCSDLGQSPIHDAAFTSTPCKEKDSDGKANASKKKLVNSSFEELEGPSAVKTRHLTEKLGLRRVKNAVNATGYSLVDMNLFQKALASSTICKVCRSAKSKISILKNNQRKHGLAELFTMKCSECNTETKFHSSEKMEHGIFEVNKRSVLACNVYKGGKQVLENFCAMMNLPQPLTQTSFSRHLTSASNTAAQEANVRMKEAASRIRKLVLDKNPHAGKIDPDGAIPVAVSIDGTWHKRGYSSKYGVVVAILVDTGEVIDYEVLSKHCFECTKHSKDNKDSEKYKKWKEGHASKCNKNFHGSSGGMEGVGALSIFKRSIDQYKLKYTTFVGDGDSDTFKIVQEGMQEMYGERYKVVKEECGHIQKRMGNALRRYLKDMKGKKLADKKSVGGKGRLTKIVIDKIQRNYGEAIRKNKGKLTEMQSAIWAIFHHMIQPPNSSPLKIQHTFCPKGETSWCKFNSDLVTGKSTYSEKQRLPAVFHKELKPIFERLTGKELLKKCLKGLTQNAHESFNNLIWNRCPKGSFCGKKRIVSAVAESVAVFNSGASGKASIIKASGIKDIGANSLFSLRKADCTRLSSTSRKVSEKYKAWRLCRKRIEREQNRKAKEHYEPGGFDSKGTKIGKKSENTKDPCSNQKKRKIPVLKSSMRKSREMEKEDTIQILQEATDTVEITRPEPLELIKSNIPSISFKE